MRRHRDYNRLFHRGLLQCGLRTRALADSGPQRCGGGFPECLFRLEILQKHIWPFENASSDNIFGSVM